MADNIEGGPDGGQVPTSRRKMFTWQVVRGQSGYAKQFLGCDNIRDSDRMKRSVIVRQTGAGKTPCDSS